MKATSTFWTIRANVWTFGAFLGFLPQVERLSVRFASQFDSLTVHQFDNSPVQNTTQIFLFEPLLKPRNKAVLKNFIPGLSLS